MLAKLQGVFLMGTYTFCGLALCRGPTMNKYMTIAAFVAVVSGFASVTSARASPGDLNCDDSVDGRDVAAFVLALLDPSAYEAVYQRVRAK